MRKYIKQKFEVIGSSSGGNEQGEAVSRMGDYFVQPHKSIAGALTFIASRKSN